MLPQTRLAFESHIRNEMDGAVRALAASSMFLSANPFCGGLQLQQFVNVDLIYIHRVGVALIELVKYSPGMELNEVSREYRSLR